VGLHLLIGPPRSFLRRQGFIGIGLTLDFRAKSPTCLFGRCRSVARASSPFGRGDARDQYTIVPAVHASAAFVGLDRLLAARSTGAADEARLSTWAACKGR
jgi:hypothetical protein